MFFGKRCDITTYTGEHCGTAAFFQDHHCGIDIFAGASGADSTLPAKKNCISGLQRFGNLCGTCAFWQNRKICSCDLSLVIHVGIKHRDRNFAGGYCKRGSGKCGIRCAVPFWKKIIVPGKITSPGIFLVDPGIGGKNQALGTASSNDGVKARLSEFLQRVCDCERVLIIRPHTFRTVIGHQKSRRGGTACNGMNDVLAELL